MEIEIKVPKRIMEEFDKLPKRTQRIIIKHVEYVALVYLKNWIKNAKSDS